MGYYKKLLIEAQEGNIEAMKEVALLRAKSNLKYNHIQDETRRSLLEGLHQQAEDGTLDIEQEDLVSLDEGINRDYNDDLVEEESLEVKKTDRGWEYQGIVFIDEKSARETKAFEEESSKKDNN
jgi:hypothetical protein